MRGSFGVRLAVTLLAAVVTAGRALPTRSPSAQSPQLPGAFRTAVTVVPVDVRVIGRDGRPVTDLRADDFSVLENGVVQEIVQFSPIGLESTPAASPDDAPPQLVLSASSATEAHQRVFLILLGRGRLQTPFKAIDALIDFVNTLSPAD